MLGKKLFVMAGGNYGYAYDAYKYVFEKEGFDLYQLDFNKKLSRTRYMINLLLNKYDTIFTWDMSRSFITTMARHTPLWKKRMKDTKLIVYCTSICGEARNHGIWGSKDSWACIASLLESDITAWNYDCRRELIQLLPKFPLDKFRVIYGGVDLELHHPDFAQQERKSIVAINNWFKPRKQIEVLIEALEFLKDWKLYVGGRFLQKEYEQKCHQMANRFGSRVQFLGFVDSKIHWLQKSSIYVTPSRYDTGVEETIEAMACGCKVLRVEGGGAEEFLPKEEILPRDFDAKFLADRILELSNNESLVMWNLDAVKSYSWGNIHLEVRKVLEEM